MNNDLKELWFKQQLAIEKMKEKIKDLTKQETYDKLKVDTNLEVI